MPTPDNAVRVADVVVKLGGRRVLDGLALEAEAGALTAVLGPNGAGKTTLIRCCTDLIRPAEGTAAPAAAEAGGLQIPDIEKGKFNVAVVLVARMTTVDGASPHYEGLTALEKAVPGRPRGLRGERP